MDYKYDPPPKPWSTSPDTVKRVDTPWTLGPVAKKGQDGEREETPQTIRAPNDQGKKRRWWEGKEEEDERHGEWRGVEGAKKNT